MLRETLFRSGLPMLVAGVCCVVHGYVAIVRREKLATYWAVAWALLIARFVVNATTPGLMTEWSSMLAGVLRIAFACTVLSGVGALRGEPLSLRRALLVSLGAPAMGHLIMWFADAHSLANWMELLLMDVLLLAAAWRLANGTMLPPFERRATAVALAVYAVCSTVAPRAPSGSALFTTAIMASWVAQLLVSFGLLATFFRLSHDGEMQVRSAMELRLTAALGEFVSVCMHCKSVRDDESRWQPLERFVARRSVSHLSHGLCPQCAEQFYATSTATT